eukprot:gnl/TRDRNA2_/TRDRNA2_189808_c0_seq1.p1 gnl/TRDRNA2_/TRDRNA2_189808_c0~~gnl/TRDRNA2_/TRDRNA2_189808_c0_seq1.p1  ORF type:complete len:264 (-),score=46.78 gnl/TRDRNA2_/TRDRNA2_189808_c0_seq1:83-760(-)
MAGGDFVQSARGGPSDGPRFDKAAADLLESFKTTPSSARSVLGSGYEGVKPACSPKSGLESSTARSPEAKDTLRRPSLDGGVATKQLSSVGPGGVAKPGVLTIPPTDAEKALGRLALTNADAVNIAITLFDLAGAKTRRSKLSEVYTSQCVVLRGCMGAPGDFKDDKTVSDFVRFWQDATFEEAVQYLCAMNKLTQGKWNVASGSDYPGQEAGSEVRFAVCWGSN